MGSFEKMLLDKGWVMCRYGYSKGEGYELIPTYEHHISSVDNIMMSYVHKDYDIVINWGLGEAYKPPTLLSPRPAIICYVEKVGDKYALKDQYNDDVMNKALLKFGDEEIYNAIINKKGCFEIFEC